jgi:ParB family transcriptional regulator, chromosome partitioning protein
MEKRGLGRGLAALIPENRSEADGSDVRQIPLGQIVPNPYQPRVAFDPEKMKELVASVQEHGILQPVLVRQVGLERYELIAGERRFRAAQQAGLNALPALVKEVTPQGQLEIAIVENLQREDIGALESARAYRRLMDDFSLTHDAIADRVGKHRSTVANTIRLLDLPLTVQNSLEVGDIQEGHARSLLGIRDEDALLKAWDTVKQKKLSVRDTENLVKQWKEKSEAQAVVAVRSSNAVDPHERALRDALQEALGTKVEIRRTSSTSGRIEIEFYSEPELQRLADAILGTTSIP